MGKSLNQRQIAELAGECGFELSGVVRADPSPDAERFLRWVADGFAGEMSYLTDYRSALRQDVRTLLPSAKSIICVAQSYHSSDAQPGPIAKYARSEDYHHVLRRGLTNLVERLGRIYGQFESKICVDTAPLLERSYARGAGLGWIGKNTCLINQERGSFLYLGEIITSLDLAPDSEAAERCGTCTRCIDACPTVALAPDQNGGYRLDSRKCISYLTIELRGPLPEHSRSQVGSHVFGCDICQDVCPWNRKAGEGQTALRSDQTLEEMAGMSVEEFRQQYRDTPLWRTKHKGFLRNVIVAMGNAGNPDYLAILDELRRSEDPLIAEHAKWSFDRVVSRKAYT